MEATTIGPRYSKNEDSPLFVRSNTHAVSPPPCHWFWSSSVLHLFKWNCQTKLNQIASNIICLKYFDNVRKSNKIISNKKKFKHQGGDEEASQVRLNPSSTNFYTETTIRKFLNYFIKAYPHKKTTTKVGCFSFFRIKGNWCKLLRRVIDVNYKEKQWKGRENVSKQSFQRTKQSRWIIRREGIESEE